MVDVRPATPDEMILAFVRAEIDSPTERGNVMVRTVAQFGDRGRLIDRADLQDERQNHFRRVILAAARGYGRDQYLFVGFPNDTSWRLITATSAEIERFKYVNHLEGWAGVSGRTRLVADGAKNLDQIQNQVYKRNVSGIANRLQTGVRFPPLIAAQCTGIADVVLVEGHTRATAYVLTAITDAIEVFVGTSPHMRGWRFW